MADTHLTSMAYHCPNSRGSDTPCLLSFPLILLQRERVSGSLHEFYVRALEQNHGDHAHATRVISTSKVSISARPDHDHLPCRCPARRPCRRYAHIAHPTRNRRVPLCPVLGSYRPGYGRPAFRRAARESCWPIFRRDRPHAPAGSCWKGLP